MIPAALFPSLRRLGTKCEFTVSDLSERFACEPR